MELFPLASLTPAALLLLRIVVGIVFFSSGKSHFQNPKERGESIGLPTNVAMLLGLAEMIAGISVAVGLFPQFGALLIIGTMLGAIYKKIFVWDTGFYADKGFGWHYDLLLLAAALVILATNGGAYILI